MAFIRPGDTVQIISNDEFHNCPHPNWQRPLREGDKILVEKVKRPRERMRSKFGSNIGHKTGATTTVSYRTQDGQEVWIDMRHLRTAYKGNKEDCLTFLDKHKISPMKSKDHDRYWWAEMTKNSQADEVGFLPIHLHRHLKYEPNSDNRYVADNRVVYIYFQTPEEAIKAAQMAWLRMTVAQQRFLLSVYAIHEIFP
jgi:hypothetical protein